MFAGPLFALAALLPANAPNVAEAATSTAAVPRIELITLGPGGEVFTYWGHSALRVVDPRDGTDSAYNFGGVELGEGALAAMMRGHVEAFLVRTSFAELLASYSAQDRTITRRILMLDAGAARALGDRLRAMAAGPRQAYAYHHFSDNCTTRLAGELDRALGGALSAGAQSTARGTYRSRALYPVREHTLLYALLDLAYSSAVDRPISDWEAAFLGPGLLAITDRAVIGGTRLVTDATDIYRSLSFDEDALWTWPWVKIYLLFVAPLCLLIAWRPRAGERIFLVSCGAIGVLLAAIWLGSDYDFFRGNWNLLVLPPSHLAAPVLTERTRRIYFLAHAAVLLALAILSQAGVITQAIGPALGFALPPTLLLLAARRLG